MKISPFSAEAAQLSKDRVLLFIFVVCTLLFLIEASLLLTSYGKLPPQVPIFYSEPWGERILGPAISLWILPVVGMGTLVVNSAISLIFFENDKFLKRTIYVAALMVVAASFYDLVKIVTLLV